MFVIDLVIFVLALICFYASQGEQQHHASVLFVVLMLIAAVVLIFRTTIH